MQPCSPAGGKYKNGSLCPSASCGRVSLASHGNVRGSPIVTYRTQTLTVFPPERAMAIS